MQAAISDLVSNVFYRDALKTGERAIPQAFEIAPKDLESVVTWVDTGVLGHRAYHQEDEAKRNFSNRAEVSEIISLLRTIESDLDFCNFLLDEIGSDEPAIGVICMYAEQKRQLLRAFNSLSWREEFMQMVKIDTVDSYQGKENRIVILSIVRSSRDQRPGFLYLPNRINVAMSRAMDRLIVVGDLRMWSGRNAELPLGRVASYVQARQSEHGYSIRGAIDNQRETQQ